MNCVAFAAIALVVLGSLVYVKMDSAKLARELTSMKPVRPIALPIASNPTVDCGISMKERARRARAVPEVHYYYSPADINFESGVTLRHVRSFDDVDQTSITPVGHNVAMTTDGVFFDADGYEITDGLTLFQTMMGTTKDPRQSLIDTHNKWGYDGQKAADILDAFFVSLTYDELIAFSKLEPKAMTLYRHARGYVLPGDPQVE